MRTTFGILFQTTALRWEDIRKGPSTEASLRHVRSIYRFREDEGSLGEDACPQLDPTESDDSSESGCDMDWPLAAE